MRRFLCAVYRQLHVDSFRQSCLVHRCAVREAADYEDLVVLPHTWESYFNITHQTLEMCRMAAVDPSVTHLVKVDDDSYVHMARLLIKVKKMPREKLFLGYMEKAGLLELAVVILVPASPERTQSTPLEMYGVSQTVCAKK